MNIHILENHDEAYNVWSMNGITGATVFHFDAHMDYSSFNDSFISVGNYISYALKDNIVDTFVWIVPSPSFYNDSIMKMVLENAKKLFQYQGKTCAYYELSTDLNRVIIADISSLDIVLKTFCHNKKILIDVDLDYFMNPYCSSIYSYFMESLPWINCEKFCDFLSKFIASDSIITISKSIFGGYTPLIYDYLAYELKARIELNVTDYAQFLRISTAINSMHLGDIDKAIILFGEISCNDESYFSSLVGSMYCYARIKHKSARKYYEKIVKLRPDYEPYLYPVDAIVKHCLTSKTQKYLSVAKHCIEEWMFISDNSQYSYINSMKLYIASDGNQSFDFAKYLTHTSSKVTCFEKDYLLGKYYFCIGEYEKSIYACKNVVNYLSISDTPTWVGQISSFENRKNSGLAIAVMLETIALSYAALKKKTESKKYALMCKRIGYLSEGIKDILY